MMNNVISFPDRKKEIELDKGECLSVTISLNNNGLIEIISSSGYSYDDILMLTNVLSFVSMTLVDKYLSDDLE